MRRCDRQCWMIGSVSPAMRKYIYKPAWWVLKHKAKALFSKKAYSMYENPVCKALKEGRIKKEELDALSTCDMELMASNGLRQDHNANMNNL